MLSRNSVYVYMCVDSMYMFVCAYCIYTVYMWNVYMVFVMYM